MSVSWNLELLTIKASLASRLRLLSRLLRVGKRRFRAEGHER